MLVDELHERYGTPAGRVKAKRRHGINAWLVNYIENTTFIVIGSCDKDRNVYMSPRGGDPGFLKIVDGNLCFRERAGNNLFETTANVCAEPSIGLLMIVPGIAELVRAFGKAALVTDQDGRRFDKLARHFAVEPDHRGLIWEINLSSWYYHCGRAVKKARVFDGDFVAEQSQQNRKLAEYVRKCDEFPG